MEIIKKFFDKVLLIKTPIFKDDRGGFFESYNCKHFNSLAGQDIIFVQDNCSISQKGVLRGLHYQVIKPQGKLVRVVKGRVFDVFVDLRKKSPTFGQWDGAEISSEDNHAIWIPEGFAHGFMALENDTIFLYKVTDFWYKEYDRSLLWNDKDVNISWPYLGAEPIVAAKDKAGTKFYDLDILF